MNIIYNEIGTVRAWCDNTNYLFNIELNIIKHQIKHILTTIVQ